DVLVQVSRVVGERNAPLGQDALELEAAATTKSCRTCEASRTGRVEPDREIEARLLLGDPKIIGNPELHQRPSSSACIRGLAGRDGSAQALQLVGYAMLDDPWAPSSPCWRIVARGSMHAARRTLPAPSLPDRTWIHRNTAIARQAGCVQPRSRRTGGRDAMRSARQATATR